MTPLPLLDGLLAPADLRGFTPEQLLALANEMRTRIKETVSAHGGHLSSNLGTVELTIALHRVFDFTSDRLLWDVGHQAYPHKLITGRARNFHTNRQQHGLSGFPDPIESPFDLAKVGHSSTAISTGVGVAEGYRRLGQKRRTVVVVGDGALTGGMSFEGLINAGELKSDLMVVLNDNGNFIDKPVGSLHTHLDRIRTGSMVQYMHDRLKGALANLPHGADLQRWAEHVEIAAHKLITPGYIFEDLGFTYFGPIDGHDLAATERMLRRIADRKGPILLHVVTKKGGGWAPSAQDPLTFHGPKGFDTDTGEFAPKAPSHTYSHVFSQVLCELATADDRVVGITAAMPSGTGLLAFAKRFPGRMYDVGICEQHSFGFVEGLAIAGLRPVLAHYSTFAQRGYDQLFQEVVVQRNLGTIVVLDRAGVVGEDGETHHGLYDIAWSRCLPGLVLMAPKDGVDLRAQLMWAHQHRCQEQSLRAAGYLIRYPREEVPVIAAWSSPTPVVMGKAEVLKEGAIPMAGRRPLAIWAYGAGVRTAWEAVQQLGDLADEITVVNARFAKPFDGDLLDAHARSHACILTIEDHALAGGFGTIVAETLMDRGCQTRLERLGFRDELVPHASRSQQLAAHGLDTAGVLHRIREILGLTQRYSITFPRTG